MQAPCPPLAAQKEAADAMPGDAVQVRVAARKRHADQSYQLFLASGEVLAQAQQPLAVLAESIHADRDGPAVGPEGQKPCELDALVLAVSGGITTKQKGDGP